MIPKITDFGLAKLLRGDEHAPANPTRSGDLLGTPSYMAPEQVEARAGPVGPATDIYGLGAILYELLTGRLPFLAESAVETLLQVKSADPVSPSRLQPKLSRDLVTICLTCLHKEPRRRYDTALALAEDLRRFQDGRPIQARPLGPAARAVKWVRRRPVIAALLGTVALVTALGFAGVAWQWREAEARRQVAEAALYRHRLARAHREWLGENWQGARDLLDECAPAERANWEWRYLDRLCRSGLLTLDHQGPVWRVAYSPTDPHLASAGDDGAVQVWDLRAGRPVHRLSPQGPVFALAYSPDGRRLAAAGERGTVRMWDARTGGEVLLPNGPPRHRSSVRGVAFSPDGRTLASAGDDGLAVIWETATGAAVHTLKGHGQGVNQVAYRPDGRHLATASWDGSVRVWDTATGGRLAVLRGRRWGFTSAAYSPDGRRLAAGNADSQVLLWDATAYRQATPLGSHTAHVFGVAFSPDGRALASACLDGSVKVWDSTTGLFLRALRGHTGAAWDVAFSPDGRRVAAAGDDRRVRVWDVTEGPEVLTLWPLAQGRLAAVAFSPDGRALVTGHDGSFAEDRYVRVWDLELRQERFTRPLPHGVGCVAVSPDGRRFAAGTGDGAVRLWGTAAGEQVPTPAHKPGPLLGLAFTAGGRLLAAGGEPMRVWDVDTGQDLHTWPGLPGKVVCGAFSPDGRRLAAAREQGPVQVWDTDSGHEVSLPAPPAQVTSVAFSRDGASLALGGQGGAIQVFEVRTGRATAHFRGHTSRVWGLDFSPDGRRLVSTGADWTAKLWDTLSGPFRKYV